MTLEKIYAKTNEQFIFIIDELDCLLREEKDSKDRQKKYLDFIRGLLKDKSYVALAYMTGILPVKKYGTHSALNMFDEYSMTDPRQFAEYVGFTEEEVKELCSRYQMDFDGLKDAVIQMLADEKYRIDSGLFQNDMTTFRTRDDVLTLLVHLGYLAFDGKSSEVYIPNMEIREEYRLAVEGAKWDEVVHIMMRIPCHA